MHNVLHEFQNGPLTMELTALERLKNDVSIFSWLLFILSSAKRSFRG